MPSITEVHDEDPVHDEQDAIEHDSGEDEEPTAGPSDSIPAASSSSKKKKKKRSKVAKILNTLKGNEVPQVMVDKVMEKVKEEHGDQPGMDEESIRRLLEQLKINDVLQGKSGLGGKNKKEVGDHKVCTRLLESIHPTDLDTAKFWNTQPVQQFGAQTYCRS
jgi:glycylpeptide N-tetradecanoyltransferase